MERIVIEDDKSRADIFMTVDAGVLWQAAERNIFSETKSEVLEANIPSYLREIQVASGLVFLREQGQ